MHLGERHDLSHHRFRFKFTELNEIYTFNSIRQLAISFVAIFIPIYFLNLGFNTWVILFYFVLFYLVEALTDLVSIRLIPKIGPKHVIILSLPFVIFHFILLQNINQYEWLVVLASIMGGISLGLYWQAYHYDFSRSKKRTSATKDVSKAFMLLYFAMMLSPLLGGVIADEFGIYQTFTLVIVLLLIGAVVLFKSGEKHCKERRIDFKKIDLQEIKGDIISRFGMGWEIAASMIIWPMFIYLILGSYQEVGLVVAVSMFFAMIAAYLTGRNTDRSYQKKSKIIKSAALAKAFIYFAKIFVASVFFVYAINIARSVLGSVLNIGLDSEIYLHADKNSRSEYIFLMELVLHLSRAIFFLILIVLSLFLSFRSVMIFGLVLGGLGALMASLMPVLSIRSKAGILGNELNAQVSEKKGADA